MTTADVPLRNMKHLHKWWSMLQPDFVKFEMSPIEYFKDQFFEALSDDNSCKLYMYIYIYIYIIVMPTATWMRIVVETVQQKDFPHADSMVRNWFQKSPYQQIHPARYVYRMIPGFLHVFSDLEHLACDFMEESPQKVDRFDFWHGNPKLHVSYPPGNSHPKKTAGICHILLLS